VPFCEGSAIGPYFEQGESRPFPPLCFSIVLYSVMYNCWSLSVHSLCSVSALCPVSHLHLLQVSFSPFPLLCLRIVPYYLMYNCWSLSLHSLCSVSALCPMSHVHLLVSFCPFPLLCFSIMRYCLMYTCCRSLSVRSLCSVSALCPTISCKPAAGLFYSRHALRFIFSLSLYFSSSCHSPCFV
jgi:hypothetical protein